jgi:hypothetical protein
MPPADEEAVRRFTALASEHLITDRSTAVQIVLHLSLTGLKAMAQSRADLWDPGKELLSKSMQTLGVTADEIAAAVELTIVASRMIPDLEDEGHEGYSASGGRIIQGRTTYAVTHLCIKCIALIQGDDWEELASRCADPMTADEAGGARIEDLVGAGDPL